MICDHCGLLVALPLMVIGVGCTGEFADCDPANIDWVQVSASTFTMGSAADELGFETGTDRGDDLYPHEVTLTRDFEIATTEFTQEMAIACDVDAERMYLDSDCSDASCAVTRTSWHAAAAMTHRLSEHAGMTPCYVCDLSDEGFWNCERDGAPVACDGYRLPTEAEWELAARSGGVPSDTYPAGGHVVEAGEEWLCEPGVVLSDGTDLTEQAWYCANAGEHRQRTGVKTPNAMGLHDLSGNVAEWCHDRYEAAREGPLVDPSGPASGETGVVRGGSWLNHPRSVRIGSRQQYELDNRNHNLGFRPVRGL